MNHHYTMTNSKFSFRRAWLDAINQIKNVAIRAEITHAVVHYGLTGERLATKSDVVDAMLSLIIAQIPKKRASRPATPEPDVRPEVEPEERNASSDPTDGAHVADAPPTTPPAWRTGTPSNTCSTWVAAFAWKDAGRSPFERRGFLAAGRDERRNPWKVK